jgi:hypothetical protein
MKGVTQVVVMRRGERWRAKALAAPGLMAEGTTKAGAIESLRQLLISNFSDLDEVDDVDLLLDVPFRG